MVSQKCTQKKCKYPISCKHNDMCMENEMQKSISSKKVKKTSTQKVGVILCHGFLSKHEQMVPLSDFVFENFGWDTHLVELRGHGYDSDNITKVTWNDWVDDVKSKYEKVSNECDKVYFIGFSLGGCVGAYVSTLKDVRFAGMVLINCPFGVKNVFNKLLPGVMIYNKICKKLNLQKIMLECITNHSEMPELNQPLINLSATNELRKMSNVSKTILDRILCPVFQIQEYNDPTVFYSSGVRAFRKIASTYKKLYTTKLNTHLTIYDKGLECSVFCKIKQFLSEIEEHKFVNIAHRGASGTCTENTLSAFEKAIEYNCDMVEFDVQYIDRKLCVFHDYTANRMFGVDKKMSDLNSGEFDKLIYANCERIPTLQQALDCINGRCSVNIEVKDSSIATNIVAIVRDYQKKKQWRNVDIVLSSFSCATVNLIRRSDSDINVSQLFHEDNVTLRDIKNFKKDYFEKNIYSVNLYVEDITQPIVEYCNENNMKIYVYTVNELRAIRFLRELGVNGVFTDYPERIQ